MLISGMWQVSQLSASMWLFLVGKPVMGLASALWQDLTAPHGAL